MRLTETQLEALNKQTILKALEVKYEYVCKQNWMTMIMSYNCIEFKVFAVIKEGKVEPNRVDIYNEEHYNDNELPNKKEVVGFIEDILFQYL